MNEAQRVDELHRRQNLPQYALDAGQGEVRLSAQFLMNTRDLIQVLFKKFGDNEQVLLGPIGQDD